MECTFNTEYRIWWIVDGMMTELNTEIVEQTFALSAHTHKHKHTHTRTNLCAYSHPLAQ